MIPGRTCHWCQKEIYAVAYCYACGHRLGREPGAADCGCRNCEEYRHNRAAAAEHAVEAATQTPKE